MATEVYTVYSRLNYKTLASIVVTGWSSGTSTLVVTGISYTTHTITAANTSASLTIDEHGDPGADTSKVWRYTGMVLTSLQLTFSAKDEAGFLVVTPTFEGQYPTAISDPTFRLPVLKGWPSWICAVTKGGSTYSRIQTLTVTINTGSKPQRAAIGTQQPVVKLDGARTVEFAGQLYLEDNTEYANWVTPTESNFHLTFTSPYAASSSVNHNLLIELTKSHFDTLDPKEDDGMIVADFTGHTLADASDEVLKATLVNAVNGAY